jgi:hypothetical protein
MAIYRTVGKFTITGSVLDTIKYNKLNPHLVTCSQCRRQFYTNDTNTRVITMYGAGADSKYWNITRSLLLLPMFRNSFLAGGFKEDFDCMDSQDEAIHSSETPATIYQSTRRHILDDFRRDCIVNCEAVLPSETSKSVPEHTTSHLRTSSSHDKVILSTRLFNKHK